MEAAFKGLLTEANRVGDYHMKIKENLCTNEIEQIKAWQKNNYHKVANIMITSMIHVLNCHRTS